MGEENANVITEATLIEGVEKCRTPEGLTGGNPAMFSSVVQLFADA